MKHTARKGDSYFTVFTVVLTDTETSIKIISTQGVCSFQPGHQPSGHQINVYGFDNQSVVCKSIPLENDGSVLLSTLKSRFRNATGLAVGKSLSDLKHFFSAPNNRLYPPLLISFGEEDNLLNFVSWAGSQTFLCTYEGLYVGSRSGTMSSDKFTTPFPPSRQTFTPTSGVEYLGSFSGSASWSPSMPSTTRSGH